MSQCSHVKSGLLQYSCEQCVTKTEGGPACIKTPGGPSHGVKSGKRRVWCSDSPRRPQLYPFPCGKSGTTPPLKVISNTSLRKWRLFNNEEVMSNIPELPFPSTHNTSHPPVPLFRHFCLLHVVFSKTRYHHLLALYK